LIRSKEYSGVFAVDIFQPQSGQAEPILSILVVVRDGYRKRIVRFQLDRAIQIELDCLPNVLQGILPGISLADTPGESRHGHRVAPFLAGLQNDLQFHRFLRYNPPLIPPPPG
jgi:hypothetical protein